MKNKFRKNNNAVAFAIMSRSDRCPCCGGRAPQAGTAEQRVQLAIERWERRKKLALIRHEWRNPSKKNDTAT